MYVIDTNVLVYAANSDAPEHDECVRRLDIVLAGPAPCYVTYGILYEFCRIVTHARVFQRPWTAAQAWAFVAELLGDPNVRVLHHGARHVQVAAALASEVPAMRGNLLFDAHTAALMREHGVRRIWTRDADFHRFPGIEVLDPLRTDV